VIAGQDLKQNGSFFKKKKKGGGSERKKSRKRELSVRREAQERIKEKKTTKGGEHVSAGKGGEKGGDVSKLDEDHEGCSYIQCMKEPEGKRKSKQLWTKRRREKKKKGFGATSEADAWDARRASGRNPKKER